MRHVAFAGLVPALLVASTLTAQAAPVHAARAHAAPAHAAPAHAAPAHAALAHAALAHVALARSPLQPLDLSKLPAACAPLAAAPRSARTATQDFAAHVSVAQCAAELALDAVTVTADAAGVAALDAAVTPTRAILDDVIAHGDPRWRLVAEQATGSLDIGMMVRLRSVTPSDPAAHAAAEALIAPWRDDASRSFLEVGAIAAAHPDLGKADPVVANAVRAAAADLGGRAVASVTPAPLSVPLRIAQRLLSLAVPHRGADAAARPPTSPQTF